MTVPCIGCKARELLKTAEARGTSYSESGWGFLLLVGGGGSRSSSSFDYTEDYTCMKCGFQFKTRSGHPKWSVYGKCENCGEPKARFVSHMSGFDLLKRIELGRCVECFSS